MIRRGPILDPMRATSAAQGTTPANLEFPEDGRRRAVVEAITPSIDGGLFPIKRVLGDVLTVQADAFADGHDVVMVVLAHRPPGETTWIELPMDELGNDQWRASFSLGALGRHAYTVAARTDAWATWRRDLRRRIDAGQDIGVDLLIGAGLVDGAVGRARMRRRGR